MIWKQTYNNLSANFESFIANAKKVIQRFKQIKNVIWKSFDGLLINRCKFNDE